MHVFSGNDEDSSFLRNVDNADLFNMVRRPNSRVDINSNEFHIYFGTSLKHVQSVQLIGGYLTNFEL